MAESILLLGLIIFSALVHGAVEIWAIIALQTVVIVWAALWLMSAVRRENMQFYTTPVDLPVLIFLGLVCVSVGISVYPFVTRTQGLKMLMYALIFYGLINTIRTRQQLMLLVTGIVVFGVIYASAGMIVSSDSLFGLPLFSSGGYNISLTFPNHSHFAGFLGMILWLCLALAFIHKGSKRALFICFAVYIGAAIAFSLSRGGFIGFLGGLTFLAFVIGFSRKIQPRFPIVVVFLIVLSAVVVWLGAEPFIQRIETLRDPFNADRTRIIVWEHTLNMIRDYPVWGAGLGTFPFVFPQYQPQELSNIFTNHAHNDYLELAAEMGLTGLICALAGFLLLFIKIIQRLHQKPERTYHALGIGALTGCFSLLVHGAGDFNFHITSNAALLVVCAGIAVVSARLANPSAVGVWKNFSWLYRRKPAASAVICLAAVSFLLAAAAPGLGNMFIRQAQAHYQAGNFSQAIQLAQQAQRVNPGNADNMALIGDWALRQYKRERQPHLMELAIDSFDQAIRYCPVHSGFYTKKARALAEIGRFSEAETAFRQAIFYHPSRAQVYRDLAQFYLERRKFDLALSLYGQCLQLSAAMLPLALDELWRAELDYQRIKQAVPETADFRQQFAVFLLSKEYHQAGAAELAAAFSLDPTGIRAADHIQQLIRFNQYEIAMSKAEHYAEIFPVDRLIKKRLAWLYDRLGKIDNAVSAYNELIKADNYDPEPYRILAGIYQKQQKYDRSIEVLLRGIEYNPLQVDLYGALYRLYGAVRQPDKALAILRTGIRRIPRSPSLYILLAAHYRQTHEPEKALNTLKILVSYDRGNPYYYFLLGEEYKRNGLFYQAVEQWKHCLEIAPKYRDCLTALDITYKHLGIVSQ